MQTSMSAVVQMADVITSVQTQLVLFCARATLGMNWSLIREHVLVSELRVGK